MQISQEQERYLWIGLDLDNFEVVRVLPQNVKEAAIIMRCKHPDWGKLWCIEHRGSVLRGRCKLLDLRDSCPIETLNERG